MDYIRNVPYIFKLEGKKYDRLPVSSVIEFNAEDINRTIDKIEAVSDDFKHKKRFTIRLIVWGIGLILIGIFCLFGALNHRKHHGWNHLPPKQFNDFQSSKRKGPMPRNQFDYLTRFQVRKTEEKKDNDYKIDLDKDKEGNYDKPKVLIQMKAKFAQFERVLSESEDPNTFDKIVKNLKAMVSEILDKVKDYNVLEKIHDFGKGVNELRVKKLKDWKLTEIKLVDSMKNGDNINIIPKLEPEDLKKKQKDDILAIDTNK